jgi:DNA-binding response OmpR family regulator
MLVDDDPSIRTLLKAALDKNGYDTIMFASGEEALDALETLQTDVVILDIILPGIDGLEVLRRIKNHPNHRNIPVIILTTKDSEVETVLGLEMGADDYLSKPVRYYELIARLKKVLQRADMLSHTVGRFVSVHGIEIDLSSRTVYLNNTPIQLTYMEYELLSLLARNPGKVFTREHLLDLLWHDGQFTETRTVDVHIRRLRKNLEEHGLNPDIIETVRSVGYRFSSISP